MATKPQIEIGNFLAIIIYIVYTIVINSGLFPELQHNWIYTLLIWIAIFVTLSIFSLNKPSIASFGLSLLRIAINPQLKPEEKVAELVQLIHQILGLILSVTDITLGTSDNSVLPKEISIEK